MKYKYLFLLPVLFIIGCATSFINTVDVSLNQNNNAEAKLTRIVEEIAYKHNLTKDDSKSTSSKKIGYFGKPYHYYIFEMQETDNKILVSFYHEARLSSRSTRRSDPEKEFLKAVQNTFGSDIIEVNYHFNED